MQNRPTTGEIVIMASGAAALVFSFFDWWRFDVAGNVTAWDDFLFPTYTWVAIIGAIMAVVIALEVFASTRLPPRVFGFTWPQIHFVLAVYAALVAVSFLVVEKGPADFGIGFLVSLLAAAGLVVGAVTLQRERPTGVRLTDAGGGDRPEPGGPAPGSPPPPPPL